MSEDAKLIDSQELLKRYPALASKGKINYIVSNG